MQNHFIKKNKCTVNRLGLIKKCCALVLSELKYPMIVDANNISAQLNED